jgi:hypothetical protein
MRKRRALFYMLVASITFTWLSACSHSREEVRVERETTTQVSPTTPVVRPAATATVRQAPPPPREEFQDVPPSPGHVWVPGYWTRGNNEWVWASGRWERPPERMATWVPGQWVQRGDTWLWRAGHWQ